MLCSYFKYFTCSHPADKIKPCQPECWKYHLSALGKPFGVSKKGIHFSTLLNRYRTTIAQEKTTSQSRNLHIILVHEGFFLTAVELEYEY